MATFRALKMRAGVKKEQLGAEDVGAVRKGLDNLQKHVENVRHFGVPAVVAALRKHAVEELGSALVVLSARP